MTYSVDAVVVGAGVVGLACARRLAEVGLETVILEKESRFGQGISARNSEVIHAGLYYPVGSLKARLCRQGRDRLYEYCRERHVAHRRTGKWVVATTETQLSKLDELHRNALRNGVDDVAFIPAEVARRMEPELHCVGVLDSPSTGIVDSHGLMTALLGDFERAGGNIVYLAGVTRGAILPTGLQVTLDDADTTSIQTRILINAAGLNAPVIASLLEGFPAEQVPAHCFAKGSYFSLNGRSPFSRLVYPLPQPGGLGIHLTLDLQGQARFGPDVEWISAPEYAVDQGKIANFAAAIKQYWPGCTVDRLAPAYAGVRPKLGTKESVAKDFMIQGPSTHGVAGLVNLFGIESPGLTSCFAIADEVVANLDLH